MNLYYRPRLTTLHLVGKDRLKLLHNLCTQEVRNLNGSGSVELFMTNVKGRILAHGHAFALGDQLCLVAEGSYAERLLAHFDRYIIRDDVMVSDATGDWVWFQVLGDGVGDLEELITIWASTGNDPDRPPLLFRWPCWGPGGRVIAMPLCKVEEFERKLRSESWQQASENMATFLRIEANWPWFGLDMDESHLPQEVDRDQLAISFTKGCYLGQETVARLDALGQVQKKLIRVQGDLTDAQPSAPLSHRGLQVGHLTSIGRHPTTPDQGMAFAYVKRTAWEPGTILRIGDGPTAVNVAVLATIEGSSTK
jgi:hypothetical protein